MELLLSLSILVIASSAAISGVASMNAQSASKHERRIAMDAAISRLEAMKAVPFRELFARYNSTRADDPHEGVSPGSAFAVPGLRPQVGDHDGLPGEIHFPGDGVHLREDLDDASFGMPRDLNLDSVVDGADHASNYVVLPVRIVVRWSGRAGNQQVELVTTLTNL